MAAGLCPLGLPGFAGSAIFQSIQLFRAFSGFANRFVRNFSENTPKIGGLASELLPKIDRIGQGLVGVSWTGKHRPRERRRGRLRPDTGSPGTGVGTDASLPGRFHADGALRFFPRPANVLAQRLFAAVL